MNRIIGRQLTYYALFAVTLMTCQVTLADGQESKPTLLKVAGYVAPDGSIAPPACVVISNGMIQDILDADATVPDATVLDYTNAILCPGLIDVHSELAARGDISETANAIEPRAIASDTFDRHHRDLDRAIRGGITTVLLAPEGNNLVCGWTVAVKTAARPNNAGHLLSTGPMKMSISPDIFQFDREPTSRSGAMTMLRNAFTAAKDGNGSSYLVPLINGTRTAMVECPARFDVKTMLRFLEEYGLQASLLLETETSKVAAVLKDKNIPVVIPPLTFQTPQRLLAGPAALERTNVDYALAGMMPSGDADAIRISAALAVRYGSSTAAARRAMTIVPARIAGIEDKTGSIEANKQADLVLFSADPLRLDAAVLAVYVDGQCVFTK